GRGPAPPPGRVWAGRPRSKPPRPRAPRPPRRGPATSTRRGAGPGLAASSRRSLRRPPLALHFLQRLLQPGVDLLDLVLVALGVLGAAGLPQAVSPRQVDLALPRGQPRRRAPPAPR